MKSHTLTLARVALAALTLVAAGCSKDPNVAKQEHFESGERYAAEGKYGEAIIEYRNAVQLDPQFGRARYRLADAYSQTGDLQAAFGEYVRAADLLDEPEVQLRAGNFLLLAGRHEDAKARAERVLAGEPQNAAAHVLRANSLAGLKDFPGAVDQMEKAIESDPGRGLSYASLGTFELLRGNRADAEAAYRKAIESDPRSAMAHMALGNYRLALNEPQEAERAFTKAVELEPTNTLALRSLAALYLTAQQPAKAEPLLRRIVDQTRDLRTRLILADIYVAMEQPGRAEQELEAIVKEKEAFSSAKLRLAALDYMGGRAAEGYAHVDELLKQDPKNVQGLVLGGRFLLLEEKTDEAIARLQVATKADPKNDSAHFWLGEAYGARGRAQEARGAYAEALRLNPTYIPAQIALSQINLRAGDADTALNFAQQAVAAAPANPDARAALVWALLGQRNVTRAADELKILARDNADASVVHVLQGTLDMVRRDPKAAEKAFAKARLLQPDSADALSGVLASRLAAGNVAGAQGEADSAIARAPNDPATLVVAGRAYLATRQFDKAEAVLKRAIERDAQRLPAYSLLGQLYVTQRRTEEAIKEFDELSKRQTNAVGAHTVVGMLMQASNRRQEAKERYQKVLALDANAAVAANNLAWMQVEDGENLDVALQLAQTASARLPESAEVSDTLGLVYIKKGLYPQAIDALKVSVERAPKTAAYHYRLGVAYAKAGDAALARQSLDRALKLDPNFSDAADARATLASLR